MNTHNEHARTVDKVPQKYTVREVLDSLCFEEVDHDEDFDGFIHITSDLDGSGTKLEMSRLTTLITKVREEVRAERDREIVEFLSTPLNTHDGVREKTVDDFVEYLSTKGNFVCPLDCGIEQEHTHPYGDIKKVYIK